MKIVVFNDTHVDWVLHVGSERGVKGEKRIPKQSAVTFEGPDDYEVFVKVWGKMVLVSFAAPDTAETLVPIRRVPPRRSVVGAGRWR